MNRARRLGLALVLLVGAFGVWCLATGEIPAFLGGRGASGVAPGASGTLRGREAEEDESRRPTLRGTAPAPGEGAEALPPPVDLARVDRLHDLHGVVRRKDGTPIPGARLQTITYPWRRAHLLTDGGWKERELGPSTRSAADGTFALRLRRGARVNLLAEAAGFAPKERAGLNAGERVTVVLEEGVGLRLLVRDAFEKPVAGAHVRFFRIGRPSDFVVDREGVTDADGRLVLDGLPADTKITMEVEESTWGASGWVTVPLPASGDMDYTLDLPGGRTITGRVTDAETGRPIAGARVGMGWVVGQAVLTDDDGRYVLPGWTGEGISDVHVLAPGYGRGAKIVGVSEVLDFQLRRGFEITGRLLGAPGGHPVGHAQVSAIASTGHSVEQRVSMDSAWSDERGRFRLQGLSRDMQHTLIVLAPGFARTLRPVPAPGGEPVADLGDVVLSPGRAVAGRVTNADGSPVQRAGVTLADVTADRGFHYGRQESRFTDDLGRFRFEDEGSGRYEVRASPHRGVAVSKEVEVVGADLEGVSLVLAASRDVLVRVVDAKGRPVDAYVQAYGPGGNVSGRTDARGEVHLSLPSGKAEITCSPMTKDPPHLAPPPRSLGPAEREVELVAAEAGRVKGRLVDAQDRPVARGLVEARQGKERVSTCVTDEEGRFEMVVPKGAVVDLVFSGQVMSGAPAASGLLTARVNDVREGSDDLLLRAAETPHDRSLDVLVLSPDGRPVESASVWVMAGGRPVPGPRRKTDERGRCRVEGLPALEVTVWANLAPDPRSETWAWPEQVKTVPDGQEVTLRFRPGVVLVCHVQEADGRPVSAAIVNVSRGTSTAMAGQTGNDGTCRLVLPVPEDGSYRVRADAGARHAESEAWRPGDGEVTLRLPGK